MSYYNLSYNTIKLLDYANRLNDFDFSNPDMDKVASFNIQEMGRNRFFRKLYRPVRKNMTCESFIIPVGLSSSVTGLLYKKEKKEASDPSSLIIYIHSGGWTFGNIEITGAVCSNICRKTGAMVLAVDYRLAPSFKFGCAIDDCYQAFLWAYQGARYWKADPSKIYIMGSSCGANLAAAVCQKARNMQGPQPAGQILIDPMMDCRLRTRSAQEFEGNPVLSKKMLDFYIKNYQREPKDILDPMFSPLLSTDFSRLPQTLIFAAEYDILYDDAELYAAHLVQADTPANLIVRKNALHGYMSYPKSDRWDIYMNCVKEFVRGISVDRISVDEDGLSKRVKTRIIPY